MFNLRWQTLPREPHAYCSPTFNNYCNYYIMGWSLVGWIENVAHSTGIDKAIVHPVTGGKRVMEKDGRVSPHLVQGLEKAFSAAGLDKVVHLGTSDQPPSASINPQIE
jgi:hypothetical protein